MKCRVVRNSSFQAPMMLRTHDKCGSTLRDDFDYEVEIVGDSLSITHPGEFLVDHLDVHSYFVSTYSGDTPYDCISCEEMCRRAVVEFHQWFFGGWIKRDSNGYCTDNSQHVSARFPNQTITKIRVRLSAYNEAFVEMEWCKGDRLEAS